jgi:hypothetical protein
VISARDFVHNWSKCASTGSFDAYLHDMRSPFLQMKDD